MPGFRDRFLGPPPVFGRGGAGFGTRGIRGNKIFPPGAGDGRVIDPPAPPVTPPGPHRVAAQADPISDIIFGKPHLANPVFGRRIDPPAPPVSPPSSGRGVPSSRGGSAFRGVPSGGMSPELAFLFSLLFGR
jgi:hypothetical protein